jgi:drug/metabolite transporter (DMT)-like permease
MRRALDLAILLLPVAIWASLVVVGVKVTPYIRPISLACVSWAVAAVVLIAVRHRELRVSGKILRQEAAMLFFCGLTGVAAFQALWYEGLFRANPINVGVLLATVPIMIGIMAVPTLGEKLSSLQILGMAIAVAGTLWIAALGQVARLAGVRLGLGEVLILVANFAISAYTIALKRWQTALSPLAFMGVVSAVGALILVPAMFLEGGFSVGWQPYVDHVGALAYIGVMSGAVAYAIWNISVIRNGANLTGSSLYVQPVFAIAFAWFFLNQPVLPYQWAGLALIVGGTVLVVLGDKNLIPSKGEIA